MDITPQSTVYILSGVPLDKNYQHTYLFNTASQQETYFKSKIKHSFVNNLTYQRYAKGSLKIQELADNLYDCNYLMFNNSTTTSAGNFANKWFYAFIDSIEYVNNQTCLVNYTIDIIQTWWFDFTLGECFIEREHQSTDVAGDNKIPENLELGPIFSEVKSRFIDTLSGVDSQLAVVFATSVNLEGSTTGTDFVNDPTAKGPVGPYIYNGVVTGVQYAVGLLNYGGANTPILTILNHLIEQRPDTIVSMHMLPAVFINNTGGVDPNGWMNINTSTTNVNSPIKSATWNIGPKDISSIGTYTPKNKKLLTHPYNYLLVTNNEGDSVQWHYEDFGNISNIVCELHTNISPDSIIRCSPRGYKGLFVNLNESIVMSGYPLGSYSQGAYEQWFAQHRNSLFASLTSSLATSAIGAVKTMLGGNPNPGQPLNALTHVGQTIAMIKDMEALPASVKGNIQAGDVNIASDNKTFVAYHSHITEEFAKIIDDYFTRFGYACHRVKTPNVILGPLYRRPYFNYVKTVGCNVLPDDLNNTCMPAEDMRRIESIFDNGITFWTPGTNIGDYSYNNAPT